MAKSSYQLAAVICFGHQGNSCLCVGSAPPYPPHSCRSCGRGWSRPRRTGTSCRRSCARSGRRENTWSAPSAISGSRWPSLAWWGAAPLPRSPLPRDPITPTPHPPPPLPFFRRPRRLARSNWPRLNCAWSCPNVPSLLSQAPTSSTDTKQEGPPPPPHAGFLVFWFFSCCFQCRTDFCFCN